MRGRQWAVFALLAGFGLSVLPPAAFGQTKGSKPEATPRLVTPEDEMLKDLNLLRELDLAKEREFYRMLPFLEKIPLFERWRVESPPSSPRQPEKR